jgi:hypothetical protein
MSVDKDVNDPTINFSIHTTKDGMQKEDTFGADDGCNRSSSEDSDHEYEDVSTRKVSQVSTGVLHTGGSPSNIHMENNSDVHIGSRLHYNAPVTINQYVHVLGKNDGTQNSILHEAVKAPIHGFDTEENISQSKFTKVQSSFHLAVLGRLERTFFFIYTLLAIRITLIL